MYRKKQCIEGLVLSTVSGILSLGLGTYTLWIRGDSCITSATIIINIIVSAY